MIGQAEQIIRAQAGLNILESHVVNRLAAGMVLAIMILPLTLAYVVVVERAMDVRMVIRQGFQYALATRGVRVLQAAFIVGVTMKAATLTTGASRPQKLAYIALGVALIA